MDEKLAQLEKVVSQVARRISLLQKENNTLKELVESRGEAVSASSSDTGRLSALSEENRRLLQERKDLRKRVRSIIRHIDKVPW